VGGQAIDISAFDVLASHGNSMYRYALAGVVSSRSGHQSAIPPSGTWHCADGDLEMQAWTPNHWEGFRKLMGEPEELKDPQWSHAFYRGQHRDQLEAMVSRFMLARSKQDVAAQAQDCHVPAGPVNTLADFVGDPQPRSRGFFVETAHPVLGTLEVPGAPYLLSRPAWALRTPAPELGQHNEAVYLGELGYPAGTLQAWQREGIV
ncbi:MAG: CoA transferase, partial [Chloroflexota bacterium]